MTIDMDKRVRFCDGWPQYHQGHYCEQAREFLFWEPGGFDDIWLCDTCAAQMCATHHLEGTHTKHVTIYRDGKFVRTEDRRCGVWQEYHL